MGDCRSKIQEKLSSQSQSLNNSFFLTLSTIYFSDKGKKPVLSTFCPLGHPVTSIRRFFQLRRQSAGGARKNTRKTSLIHFSPALNAIISHVVNAFVEHEDVCSSPRMKFWKQSTTPSISCQCTFCGKDVLGVFYCQTCKVFGCMKCIIGQDKKKKCSH